MAIGPLLDEDFVYLAEFLAYLHDLVFDVDEEGGVFLQVNGSWLEQVLEEEAGGGSGLDDCC